MFELNLWLAGLVPIAALAVAAWLLSLRLRDVSIVDSFWSLFFAGAAVSYTLLAPITGIRAALTLALLAAWALRLALHVTWRNWGEGEDRRYQAIRARNQPHFAVKSLYLVFGLQGLLAWVISLPLLAAIVTPAPLAPLDYAGAALALFGLTFETIADSQLMEFKARPGNRGRVLDRGLWRYSRHPNYFGEFCVWWGFFLIALAAGAWWAVVAPLLMSFLLLRVSGVVLLERDIAERRPAYRDYVARTNAFFPGPPRAASREEA